MTMHDGNSGYGNGVLMSGSMTETSIFITSFATNAQSQRLKTYFKKPEGRYKLLHYQNTHSPVLLLPNSQGKSVSQVTDTADCQKESLYSLDRVELAMAFEQEFSIEILDEKPDKLTCCADVASGLDVKCRNLMLPAL